MMDAQQAQALRAPFPTSVVGKLPRSTCKACSDSSRRRCDQHTWVVRCPECHGAHSAATIHLDYVGHAATTDRLLQVDPAWTWEPMALDANGLPALDRSGNLWIRLTVAGVTRLGVGDGKSAKECIGDAIRNAAMRFGVALDLWAKEDLHTQEPGQHAEPAITKSQLTALHAILSDRKVSRDEGLEVVSRIVGHPIESTKDLTVAEASAVIEAMKGAGDA